MRKVCFFYHIILPSEPRASSLYTELLVDSVYGRMLTVVYAGCTQGGTVQGMVGRLVYLPGCTGHIHQGSLPSSRIHQGSLPPKPPKPALNQV